VHCSICLAGEGKREGERQGGRQGGVRCGLNFWTTFDYGPMPVPPFVHNCPYPDRSCQASLNFPRASPWPSASVPE
jgi:hypothetical protein